MFLWLISIGLHAKQASPFIPPPKTESHVHIEQKDYHGWKSAYRVWNDTVEIVIVPQLGRVMRYAYLNGDNLLWENASIVPGSKPQGADWTNYGGDKVWVAPQSNDTWPPDRKVDPGPYSVERLANGLRLTNPPDSKFQVRISRDIVLADYGSKVSFTNRLQNLGPPRKLCPWQVTQIDNPELVILPIRSTGYQPHGYYDYGNSSLTQLQDLRVDSLWLKRDPSQSRKFGATGVTGELQAVKHSTVIHVVQSNSLSALYPDRNSAQQVYLSSDPNAYVELEQLGPLANLQTHEVTIQKVVWSLSQKL